MNHLKSQFSLQDSIRLNEILIQRPGEKILRYCYELAVKFKVCCWLWNIADDSGTVAHIGTLVSHRVKASIKIFARMLAGSNFNLTKLR